MQLQDLRWFVDAVEEPNLTRLAGRLHISQPALSRALQRLEGSVGLPLFDRIGRTLEPNRHGVGLATAVRRGLAEIEDGFAVVRREADPSQGEVRLGFLHTLGSWLVPALIGAYREEHPHVRFRLGQDAAGVMTERLLAGQHDLILTSPRPVSDAIGGTELFREPLRLAVPPGHRLAQRRRVRLAEVAGEPFITMRDGYGLRLFCDELCARAGFTPRVAFESEEVETMRGLVAAGLGVALLPDRPGRPPSPPLLGIADPGASRSINLCWNRSRERSPAAVAFAEFVADAGPRSIGLDLSGADPRV